MSPPSQPLPTPAAPVAQRAPWPFPLLIKASLGLHAGALATAALWPQSWPLGLGAVAANHALLTATGLWPRSTWLGPNVRRLPADAGTNICITIDDGPDPNVTPQVLDVLDAHGAKATFFCIATQAQQHRALTREIVRRGHCVQNHSATHSHRFSLMGPAGLAHEIEQGQAILSDITGRTPHSFRAPAGLRNPLLDPVLHRLGLHLVSWTRRGFDTRDGQAPRVLARLAKGLRAGDILLLHDRHARQDAAGQPVLLAVLPALLRQAQALGLGCTTLSQSLPPRRCEPIT